jgi:hypothetical protein
MTRQKNFFFSAKLSNEDLRRKWLALLKEGTESDGWGQQVEAMEAYEALSAGFSKAEKNQALGPDDRNSLAQLATCMRLRLQSLNDATGKGLTLGELKPLTDVVASLFTGNAPQTFPVDLGQYQSEKARLAAEAERKVVAASVVVSSERGGAEGASGSEASAPRGGTLLRIPPPFPAGGTLLVLTINKIGLKDATTYLRPYMTVSFRWGNQNIEAPQDTPISTNQKEQFVIFETDVYMQCPLEEARKEGAAIFFEFKHYKPKKDKISTKAWSFLPIEAIKQGNIVLEIYQKPTDWTTRKPKLLSVKPLYLELVAALRKH